MLSLTCSILVKSSCSSLSYDFISGISGILSLTSLTKRNNSGQGGTISFTSAKVSPSEFSIVCTASSISSSFSIYPSTDGKSFYSMSSESDGNSSLLSSKSSIDGKFL